MSRITVFAALLASTILLSSCAASSGGQEQQSGTESETIESPAEYDWGTLAPVEEDIEYSYAFSPYLITSDVRAALTYDGYNSYCSLIDAIERYNAEVPVYACDADTIISALAECYPPHVLVDSFSFTWREGCDPSEKDVPAPVETLPDETDENGEILESASETEAVIEEPAYIRPDEPDGMLTLNFIHNKEEHDSLLEQFYSSAAYLLGGTAIGEYDESSRALLLYSRTASLVNDLTGKRTDPFAAVSQRKASPAEYDLFTAGESQSAVFRYLLMQAGIECASVGGICGGAERIWSAAKLDGEWYHFDLSLECTDTNGRGLSFFGMSDSSLSAAGYSDYRFMPDISEYISYERCGIEADETKTFAPEFTSDKFAYLRDCDSAVFGENEITVYHRSGSVDSIELVRPVEERISFLLGLDS